MRAVTPELLAKAMPYSARDRVQSFAQPLTDAMVEFSISTAIRQAMFLANVAHETGSLFYMCEIADGSAYEGRADLGNTQPGDGTRFRGRGGLMATGRDMHTKLRNALGLDCVANPQLLEQPGPAARSAAWIWTIEKKLNVAADARKFWATCKAVNGGTNGLDDRIEHYVRCCSALGLA